MFRVQPLGTAEIVKRLMCKPGDLSLHLQTPCQIQAWWHGSQVCNSKADKGLRGAEDYLKPPGQSVLPISECNEISKMLTIPKWLQQAVGHETTLQVLQMTAGSGQRVLTDTSPKQGWRSSPGYCGEP